MQTISSGRKELLTFKRIDEVQVLCSISDSATLFFYPNLIHRYNSKSSKVIMYQSWWKEERRTGLGNE